MMRHVLQSASRLLRAPAVLLIALAPAACTDILGDFDGGGPGQGAARIRRRRWTGPPALTAIRAAAARLSAPRARWTASVAQAAVPTTCAARRPATGFVRRAMPSEGTPGTCVPVPANTDPDMECVLAPVPDAGAGAAGDAQAAVAPSDAATDASSDAATDASSDTDVDVSDAGASDAAVDGATDGGPNIGYNPPDGGIVVRPGAMRGLRAMALAPARIPDQTKNCGTQVLQHVAQQAGSRRATAREIAPSISSSCSNYRAKTALAARDLTRAPARPTVWTTSFCNGVRLQVPCRGRSDSVTVRFWRDMNARAGYCVPTAVGTICCNTDVRSRSSRRKLRRNRGKERPVPLARRDCGDGAPASSSTPTPTRTAQGRSRGMRARRRASGTPPDAPM